jgi:hypothetical protein
LKSLLPTSGENTQKGQKIWLYTQPQNIEETGDARDVFTNFAAANKTAWKEYIKLYNNMKYALSMLEGTRSEIKDKEFCSHFLMYILENNFDKLEVLYYERILTEPTPATSVPRHKVQARHRHARYSEIRNP